MKLGAFMLVAVMTVSAVSFPLNRLESKDVKREETRRVLIADVEAAWIRSQTSEPLRLLVVDCDEKRRAFKASLANIFPRGVDHLPAELEPRQFYPREPLSAEQVQYIGRAEREGFHFALFRLVSSVAPVSRR